jgi:hypothetical protein
VGGASTGADVLFEWYTTRETKYLNKLIPIDFSDTIQCDGYSASTVYSYQSVRDVSGRSAFRTSCCSRASSAHSPVAGTCALKTPEDQIPALAGVSEVSQRTHEENAPWLGPGAKARGSWRI